MRHKISDSNENHCSKNVLFIIIAVLLVPGLRIQGHKDLFTLMFSFEDFRTLVLSKFCLFYNVR